MTSTRTGLVVSSYGLVVSGEVNCDQILWVGVVVNGLDNVDDLYVVVFCYGWKEQAGALQKILINCLN